VKALLGGTEEEGENAQESRTSATIESTHLLSTVNFRYMKLILFEDDGPTRQVVRV
jgi:hypothetical protein